MANSPLPPLGHSPSNRSSAQTRATLGAERRARLDEIGFRAIAVQLPAARRDAGARQALRDRILSEFREMPGMTLTVPQAARLFGIPTSACERILVQCTQAGVLHRRQTGCYGLPRTPMARKVGSRSAPRFSST